MVKKIRDKASEKKLVVTLGQVAVMSMRDMGLVDMQLHKVESENETTSYNIVTLNDKKSDKKTEDKTKHVVLYGNKDHLGLVGLSEAITRGLVPNEKLLPSKKSIEQIKMVMKRTNIPVTKEKMKAINDVLNKVDFSIDFSFMEYFADMSFGNSGGFNRDQVLTMMGYKTIDKNKDNIDTIDTKEAHNKALEEEYDNMNKFVESLTEENTDPEKIKFYMDYFVSKNGRINNDQTTGNIIQQKQYARQIISFSEPAKVNWSNDIEVMAFYRMLLQNMGEKIEKIDLRTPKELFNLLQNVYHGLDKNNNPTGKTAPINLKSKTATAEWAASHEGLMSLKTFMEVKKLMPLLEIYHSKARTKDEQASNLKELNKFTTRVTVEVDGITNGVGLSLLQYGATNLEEFKKIANRVGMFLSDQDMKSYAEYKGLDGYQGTSQHVLNGVETKDEFGVPKLTSLKEDAKKDKGLNVIWRVFNDKLNMFGRQLAKYPLMTYFYGSGEFATSNLVATDMWEAQLANIKTPEDMKNLIETLHNIGIHKVPLKTWKAKTGKEYPDMKNAPTLEAYFLNSDGSINWKNFTSLSFKNTIKVKVPIYDIHSRYDSNYAIDDEGKIKTQYKTFEDAILSYYAQKIGKRYYAAIEAEYGHFGRNTALLNKAAFSIGEMNDVLMRDEGFREALNDMPAKTRNAFIKKIQPTVMTFGSNKEEGALMSKILTLKDQGKKAGIQNQNTGTSTSVNVADAIERAALKSGAPSLIHHFDAAIMAKTLILASKKLAAQGFKIKATQIYDAVITQHDQSGLMARAYNEAMIEISQDYSVTAAVTQALMDKYLFLTQYANGLGQMLDDHNIYLSDITQKRLGDILTVERDGRDSTDIEDRTSTEDIANPDNIIKPMGAQLREMIIQNNKIENAKVEFYKNLKHLNQVSDGSQDSVFEIKEAIAYKPKLFKINGKTEITETTEDTTTVQDILMVMKMPVGKVKPYISKNGIATGVVGKINAMTEIAQSLYDAQSQGKIFDAQKLLSDIISKSANGEKNKTFSQPYGRSDNNGESYTTYYDKAEHIVNKDAWLTVGQAKRFQEGKQTENDINMLKIAVSNSINDEEELHMQEEAIDPKDTIDPVYGERDLQGKVFDDNAEVLVSKDDKETTVLYEAPKPLPEDDFIYPTEMKDATLSNILYELDIKNPLSMLKAMQNYYKNLKFDFTTSSKVKTGDKITSFEFEDGSWDSGTSLLRIKNNLRGRKQEIVIMHEFGHAITADYIEKHPNNKEIKSFVNWISKNIHKFEDIVQN